MSPYRCLLFLIILILADCQPAEKRIDGEVLARQFYEAMSGSDFEKIKTFHGDSVRVASGGAVTTYGIDGYRHWVQWDSVFQPTYQVLEIEVFPDSVDVVVSKVCTRISYLNDEPAVTRERLHLRDGKVHSLNIVEVVSFNEERWVSTRDTLVAWIDRNHPDLNGFIFDQTLQGGLNYLRAIDLYEDEEKGNGY